MIGDRMNMIDEFLDCVGNHEIFDEDPAGK
jgi:hypothetical protein